MKTCISVLISAFCLLVPCFAQEQPAAALSQRPLDLDVKTAVDMAVKHSYSLKQSLVDLKTAETMLSAAWTTFYPSASLSASLSSNGNVSKLGAGVNFGLSLGVSRVQEIQALGNEFDIARIQADQSQAQLVVQVKKYYWNLVIYSEQIAMLQSQSEASNRRLATVQAKYDLGILSEIDKLSAEYDYKSKLVELQAAQNTYRTNLLQFTQILGIDATAQVKLSDTIPEPAAIKAVIPGNENNPELALMNLNYRAAEITRDKSLSALFPTLSFGLSVSWAFARDPFTTSIFTASDWTSSPGFSMSLSVPLDSYLPYGGLQQNIIKQDASLQKLAFSIQDRRDSVQREAQRLLLDLKQIETQIDSLLLNVNMAKRNLELVEQLFLNGRKSLLEVKDAENNLNAAFLKLLQARYNHLSDILDLEYLLDADLGL